MHYTTAISLISLLLLLCRVVAGTADVVLIEFKSSFERKKWKTHLLTQCTKLRMYIVTNSWYFCLTYLEPQISGFIR